MFKNLLINLKLTKNLKKWYRKKYSKLISH